MSYTPQSAVDVQLLTMRQDSKMALEALVKTKP